MKKQYYYIYVLLLFMTSIGLMSTNISKPWIYRHDDNGKWHTDIARTHLIKGLSETRGQDFFASQDGERITPYIHHPPLTGLYIALVFYLSNNSSPITTRTAIAFLHIISLILFFLIANILFRKNIKAKIWALLVFLISPMSVFFGKMPNHEPVCLPFLLAAIYFFIRAQSPKDANKIDLKWTYLCGASLILVCISAWHGIFVALCFLLFNYIFNNKKKDKDHSIFLIMATIVATLLVCTHMLWANNWQLLTSQKISTLYWMSPGDHKTYLNSFRTIFLYVGRYIGPLPTIFSGFWMLLLTTKLFTRSPISYFQKLIFSLCIGTIIYNIVFPNAAATHPYQQFYLLPFVALSSGAMVSMITSKIEKYNSVFSWIFFSSMIASTIFLSLLYLRVIYTL